MWFGIWIEFGINWVWLRVLGGSDFMPSCLHVCASFPSVERRPTLFAVESKLGRMGRASPFKRRAAHGKDRHVSLSSSGGGHVFFGGEG